MKKDKIKYVLSAQRPYINSSGFENGAIIEKEVELTKEEIERLLKFTDDLVVGKELRNKLKKVIE